MQHDPIQMQQVDSEIARHIQSLKDSDVEICRDAAESLVLLGVAAVPALIHALKDDDWEVRWYATEALGKIGDAQAIPALIERLADSVKEVRWLAAAALSKMGDISSLAQKILADVHIMPFQKLKLLINLWTLRPQSSLHVRYSPGILVRPVLKYCVKLLERDEVDQVVKEGARAVLIKVKQRFEEKTLMRAAERDLTAEQEKFLRAASSFPDVSAPSELVRASEGPTQQQSSPSNLQKRLRAIRNRFRPQK